MSLTKARDYNRAQLAAGKLTIAHVTELVMAYQGSNGLEVDGMAGSKETLPSLDKAIQERVQNATTLEIVPLPGSRCWPLRCLPDGRKPVITSQFRRPDRPNHPGVDIFYPYRAGDPAMRIGDGGREKKWWIPEGTEALAVADGKVVLAGKVPTGFRVWLDIGDDYRVGYMHLSELLVQVGEEVTRGTPVGIIGDNPIDTDPDHLHFELHRGSLDGYPRGLVDPEQLLTDAPYLT